VAANVQLDPARAMKLRVAATTAANGQLDRRAWSSWTFSAKVTPDEAGCRIELTGGLKTEDLTRDWQPV
jgi:hypothetical protein